jgi:hypothetical protein
MKTMGFHLGAVEAAAAFLGIDPEVKHILGQHKAPKPRDCMRPELDRFQDGGVIIHAS